MKSQLAGSLERMRELSDPSDAKKVAMIILEQAAESRNPISGNKEALVPSSKGVDTLRGSVEEVFMEAMSLCLLDKDEEIATPGL